MNAPTLFSVSPSQSGYVLGTEFTFNVLFSCDSFTIDYGDGHYGYSNSDEQSVSHFYQFPGKYLVSLSGWNVDQLIVDSCDIKVNYLLKDQIVFSQIPAGLGFPGQISPIPFTVKLTSTQIDPQIGVELQSLNSASIPDFAVPHKWNFLVPRWRFVDADTQKTVDSNLLLVDVEPIYYNSIAVAVTGQKSFYYIDDSPSIPEKPLTIIATLSTKNFSYPLESLIYPYFSYSNSKVAQAVIAWQINSLIPTKLKVTENFLSDVYPIKWAGVPIPVMITCQFDPMMLDIFGGSETKALDVLTYPRTNELGQASPVTIILSSADQGILTKGIHFNVDSDLYFQATDSNNNAINGYVFTTITPLCSLSSTLVVAASTVATNQIAGSLTARFGFPDGFAIHPDVYISNPFKSNIFKINIVTYPANCDNINYYKNLGALIEGTTSFIDVPTNQNFNVSVHSSLSGTAGVYGMAFNPTINRLYAVDADQDTLLALNNGTTLVNSVQLSSFTGYDNNTPSYISIDRFGNIWISLYGYERLLKFDTNLNYLLSAAPPIPLGTFAFGSPFVAPPVVETDFDSNVWVCCAHPLNSLLFKLSGTNGDFMLSAAEFSLSSVPVSISINADNNVWVACREINTLELYSGSNGTKIETLSGLFYRPSYTAMDRANNIWFTHGHDFCAVYNHSTSTLSSWRFNSSTNTITPVLSYSQADVDLALTDNEIWGGIAVDVFNRVWAIDSKYNTVWLFNPDDPISTARSFVVIPEPNTNYIVIGGSTYTTPIPDNTVRSAQAAGDWTGNKWYQKYAGSGVTSLNVKGQSTPFRVYDLDNSYKIAKINEGFNFANYMKSLALPEILSQNTNFFDEFLKSVAGSGDLLKEDVGQIIYERIANYGQNHSDVDTAEIPQLESLATQLSIPVSWYLFDYPTEISRLVNLFSIPKSLLRGQPRYQTDIQENIGDQLTEQSLISATQILLMKDSMFDLYNLVFVNALNNGQTVYPLSALEIEGVRQPFLDNYLFFQYNERQIGYQNNIIDWDSNFTTVNYSLSTEEQWFGDNGLVETMFNNVLTKQLFAE